MGMDVPLFSMLEDKLRYVGRRERLIGENIANSDTPGFQPRDLKSFSFGAMPQPAGVVMRRTSAAHLEGAAPAGAGPRAVDAPDSETRLDGNSVVLEEEMSKMTESRIDFEAAIDFYQQANGMLAMAARAPGKSS